MTTRKRRTTRSMTGRSTTRRRTTTRRTTTRRRRPKLATVLGAAAAMGLVYAYRTLTWPWLVAIGATLVALIVVWFLWSRRGDIYDEMQTQREDEGTR